MYYYLKRVSYIFYYHLQIKHIFPNQPNISEDLFEKT